MKKIGLILTALIFSTTLYAQSPTPNLARLPDCVAAHNGGGATTYGAQNYNDGVISANGASPCGTALTPWGWFTAPTGWIQFTWNNGPQYIGEITFYYGSTCTRYMQGGQLQYWNGTTFVTFHTFSFPDNQTWVRTVQFPEVYTNQIRIVATTVTGSQASNPSFREVEVRRVCTDPEAIVNFEVNPATEQPQNVSINYSIMYPLNNFNATLTFNFRTTQGALVYSETTNVNVTPPGISSVYNISSMKVNPGYYILEVVFNVKDACGKLVDKKVTKVIMIVPQGSTPCIVWPGDVNNDGIVNYADRSSLNKYIFDANLRPTWLNGPARYRVDAGTNPLAYLTWEAQPSIPWFTQDGCYMDADGNGTINNFDHLAIKLNYLKSHMMLPKSTTFVKMLVGVSPNPVVTTSTINYLLQESSNVEIFITDVSGKITNLHKTSNDVGYHSYTFDRSNFTKGVYFISIVSNGQITNNVIIENMKINVE